MEDEIRNEETQKEVEKEREVSEKPLDKMTAKELREIALEVPELSGVHAMKKEELLDAIKKHRGIVDEEPSKKIRKKKQKGVTASDLKKKIAKLAQEKASAREERDRKRVTMLRRRINRLKKQTRKVAVG